MPHETRDFETRKSLHVNLTRDTHSALRVLTFQHNLSMQEIFEELAVRIVDQDPEMLKFLEELQIRKKHRQLNKLAKTDAESIYRVIASEDTSGAPEDE